MTNSKGALKNKWCAFVSTALLTGFTSATAWAEEAGTPLERPYVHQFNFATGVTLDKGEADAWIGLLHNTPASKGLAVGTGNQLYFGGVNYAISDRFTLGFGYSSFGDPPPEPIAGARPLMRIRTATLLGRVRLMDDSRWKVAAEFSTELANFRNLLGVDGIDQVDLIGSLNLPISYALNDKWLLTAAPGVSFLPDTLGGGAFYGTVGQVGFGATWKPSQRWAAYGSINVPVTGNNTITSTGAMDKVPVWTIGGRHNITPKAALDVVLTNGFGVTPSTRILTFFPDGDRTMVGAMVTYTPGDRAGYRPNYRGLSGEPITHRQQDLQLDGITLSSPDTLNPGRFVIDASFGSQGSYAGNLQFSPDYDLQIEAGYEQWADDGSVTQTSVPSMTATWVIGGTMRLMDQNNGSVFSLAGKILMGQDTENRKGTFFASLPMSYKISNKFALLAEPKASFFGSTENYGLGLGANAVLGGGIAALAEIMPVSEGSNKIVWAAGLRWQAANTGLALDLNATNAIGRFGHGTMVAQDDVKITFGGKFMFDARDAKFW